MGKKLKILSCLAVLACLLSFAGCNMYKTANTESNIPKNGLNVHMIDVGQGDSFLIECSNKYMLVDAGEVDAGEDVVKYLNSHNVNKLDYAVISHPHSDHFGGMQTVLENIDTENIVMTEKANTIRVWESLIDYIDQNNYNVIFPETNDTFNLGECTVTAFVPDVKNTDDINNCSIVLRAEYNGMAALFTGDAEKSEEKLIMNSGFDISADLLKIGHHGSSTSTDTEFLQKANPKLALISCGKNNEYGHPHVETTANLRKYSIYSRRTDQDGDIVVNLNEGKLTIVEADGTSSNVTVHKTEASSQSSSYSSYSESSSQSNSYSSYSENSNNNSNISTEFVGNKNSHIFHKKQCSSVNKMSDKNKVYFDNRESAVNDGYTPCSRCNP